MTLTASGGLVWGLSVRPDHLIHHLDIHKELLPTFNAFRLCHRFGKGPDVHVTKLPIELEQAIESIIFESKHDRWDPHLEAFEHFESRCQPSDHVYDDRHLDLRDDAYEEVCDELCEACQEDQFHVDGCKEDCNDRVLQCMNEMCGDGDEGWERVFCEPMWKGWKELTSDAKFEPYQKVLREHFGLEAYLATTQVNEKNRDSWPEHKNHMWHDPNKLSTTICYLIIPQSVALDAQYEMFDYHGDMSNVYGVESCFFELPILQEKERRAARFKRALRALHLQPFVHSSQLKTKMSATSSAKGPSQAELKTDEKKSVSDKMEAGNIEWPQPIMVVKTSFHWD